MEISWWFGFVVSGLLALLRYRVPAIPPRLASAGIGAFLVIAVLGFVTLPVLAGLSLVANGALAGALLDNLISRRLDASPPEDEARSAKIVLNFRSTASPSEVSRENIHSWYSTSLMLVATDAEGNKQRHVMQKWMLAIWFQKSLDGYSVDFETLSGEPIVANVAWQTDRGFFAIIEPPDSGSVVEIMSLCRS